MDVVYNHVADAASHSFEQLVPGYFFRMLGAGVYADGTGCGNEIASEHSMVRKYIVDSVKYWASEYKLDGFRFDLMGILDVETMQQVRSALNDIDPTILVIGEGWNMGELPQELKAYQGNAGQLAGIGMFNDGIRDGIKGSAFNGSDTGWASGSAGRKLDVKQGIVGNIQYGMDMNGNWGPMDPGQSVNYVEAHDNLTLWDKLVVSVDSAIQRPKIFRLASSISLLAQGMPFLHAGQEFMRSKDGDENSYNSGDEVNSLKWNKRSDNISTVNYFKGLIALRKAHPAFRMSTTNQIIANLSFLTTGSRAIAYQLNGSAVGDSWDKIVVIHNADTSAANITLPSTADWKVVVNADSAGIATLATLTAASSVTVPAQSTFVLYK